MKNYLRNSRPFPYKTLSAGGLYNGIIEKSKKDVNTETNDIAITPKDGVTIYYFNNDITELTDINVKITFNVGKFSRLIVGPYLISSNREQVGDIPTEIEYVGDENDSVSIGLTNNDAEFRINKFDIGEYKNGAPLYVNKIGNLVFVEMYGER